MNAQLCAALSENQKAALVSLLADEDPAIYHMIRSQLLAYGSSACEWLRPHMISPDPVMRRRSQEIVRHLARGNGDTRFLDFCLHHGEALDLEEAAFLLAQTQYPDTNLDGYRALFDEWAGAVRAKVTGKGEPEIVLGALNRFLFEQMGFEGDPNYGDYPESGYLNCVIDRRMGNPICLSALYLLIARRLQLPVAGIGLPGHFICRYQSSTKEMYIDAFHGGKIWQKVDCVRFLLRTRHPLQEGYLAPVTPRRMLLRMCANLHQTYSQLEMAEEATRTQRYLVALAK